MAKTFQFAARKGDAIKLFETEEEAFKYADENTAVARYSTTNGRDFDFVEIAGIKTDAGIVTRILES
jgi:alkanesulfonate monooxygenase SsuD/methylene tetrahydromethanopterin reductase-like flavin-dependent oxidoreductase (luciferase family)